MITILAYSIAILQISLATLHLFDVILSLPISLSQHLLTISCTEDTPSSHTSHENGREHLQEMVELFLSIVPIHLCSAAYDEYLGYHEYILEAQSQVPFEENNCIYKIVTVTAAWFSHAHPSIEGLSQTYPTTEQIFHSHVY